MPNGFLFSRDFQKLKLKFCQIANFFIRQFAGFHSRDKQIGLPLRGRRFCYHSYDYRPNLTPFNLVTITAQKELV